MTVFTAHLEEHRVGGRRLGRHVEHDPRSRHFAVAEAPGAAALAPVLHRRSGGPFNQGNVGSCTGNAAEGLMNTAPFHRYGMRLSTEATALDTYAKATAVDGIPGAYPPDDTGSSGLAVCKVLLQEGRISGYGHAFSLLAAVTALMSQPVITGVPWYEGFDTPDAHGLVGIAGQVRGGHEFEVLGFVPATAGDPLLDGIVTAENSWGLDWGVRGRFHFTGRTWAELLAQQGDVTVPYPLP